MNQKNMLKNILVISFIIGVISNCNAQFSKQELESKKQIEFSCQSNGANKERRFKKSDFKPMRTFCWPDLNVFCEQFSSHRMSAVITSKCLRTVSYTHLTLPTICSV